MSVARINTAVTIISQNMLTYYPRYVVANEEDVDNTHQFSLLNGVRVNETKRPLTRDRIRRRQLQRLTAEVYKPRGSKLYVVLSTERSVKNAISRFDMSTNYIWNRRFFN